MDKWNFMKSSGMSSNLPWLHHQNVRQEPTASLVVSHPTFNSQDNDKSLRKRKFYSDELEERSSNKMFLTEEKMIKELETLSLELSNTNDEVNNYTLSSLAQIDDRKEQTPIVVELGENDDEIDIPTNLTDFSTKSITETDEDDVLETANEKQRFELHQLVKENWKRNGNLIETDETNLLNKLFELERKKLSMQLVPYMSVIPSHLRTENISQSNTSVKIEEQVDDDKDVSTITVSTTAENQSDKNTNIDGNHLFKKPFAVKKIPSSDNYTVEEPPEIERKTQRTMKRSYSQSARFNNNLTIVEIKDNIPSETYCDSFNDDSRCRESQPSHTVSEPATPRLLDSGLSYGTSSLPLNNSSVRITEFFDKNDFSSSFDDDMVSISSSDVEKMDADSIIDME
ncbi:unnamed protein product [Didymodactylos carnosus]|uniref:Uncharacterized protein n=1 Tax=Didymodactylos carnosus TaxID=1234261 RepID=A0A814LBU3_9BILA|nr:unnamed protein product [Didymodactylos carnosus]CAF1063023.1 unnamed protein product [Didymodactylos carnosus]CAF3526577.1 unnamed protein product [Didymodactylos carnosus]CAF3831004.1 unnamed protein product [Didymodactylos carnosus]